jgi:peptidoglycan/xylan/chitin deacetylase (PgdA/CDA1 family)
MRRVPLPGWLLALSTALFLATWLFAPAETLSGQLPYGAVPPLPRTTQALRLEARTKQLAAAQRQRPARVRGFGHPYEIALTYDDGPHPYHTKRLLDILHRHRVKGAFFINGMWLKLDPGGRNRAVLRQAHLEGHLIGNHTYSHELLSAIPPKQQTWQIVTTDVLLSNILGERPRVFRPPYGQMTRHASSVLARYGYQEVLWNVSATEDHDSNAKQLAWVLLMQIKRHRGGIVLLHDRHRASVDATALLLSKLRQLNCKRLEKSQPLYRVVALDSFLGSPAESQALAPQRAAARRSFRARLRERCSRN